MYTQLSIVHTERKVVTLVLQPLLQNLCDSHQSCITDQYQPQCLFVDQLRISEQSPIIQLHTLN